MFLRGKNLVAQAFDASRLVLKGDPFPIAEAVRHSTNPNNPRAAFTVSQTGMLAYVSGALSIRIAYSDRLGKQIRPSSVPIGYYVGARFSPDGRRLAYTAAPDQEFQKSDIWIEEITRGVITRFTFDSSGSEMPVWSPDGAQIAYGAVRKSGHHDIYIKPSNGTGAEQSLVESESNKDPEDWSADGRWLLYTTSVGFGAQVFGGQVWYSRSVAIVDRTFFWTGPQTPVSHRTDAGSHTPRTSLASGRFTSHRFPIGGMNGKLPPAT